MTKELAIIEEPTLDIKPAQITLKNEDELVAMVEAVKSKYEGLTVADE